MRPDLLELWVMRLSMMLRIFNIIKIKIEISFPFCAVSFDEDCQVTAIMFLGGFNDGCGFSRIIYLSETKIISNYFYEIKREKIRFHK